MRRDPDGCRREKAAATVWNICLQASWSREFWVTWHGRIFVTCSQHFFKSNTSSNQHALHMTKITFRRQSTASDCIRFPISSEANRLIWLRIPSVDVCRRLSTYVNVNCASQQGWAIKWRCQVEQKIYFLKRDGESRGLRVLRSWRNRMDGNSFILARSARSHFLSAFN